MPYHLSVFVKQHKTKYFRMKAVFLVCDIACIRTTSLLFVTKQTVWKSSKTSWSYDYLIWANSCLSTNECAGEQEGPIQDGGRTETSAPVGSISP